MAPFLCPSRPLLLLVALIMMTRKLVCERPPATGFWLSVDLIAVEFRKGCLSTALCHQPVFKLMQTMTLNGQMASMSWPVQAGLDAFLPQQDSPRHQFVAHWTIGDPEDVSIGCLIGGSDPTFGFARVCDESPAKRILEQMVRIRAPQTLATEEAQPQADSPSVVVQQAGRCFNATLAVRKHIVRCPWCPDPNVHIHVVGGSAGQQAEGSQLQGRDDPLEVQNALILALSGAVVFSLGGLCCISFAHLRYRKRRATSRMGGGNPSIILGRANNKKRTLKLVSPPRAQRGLGNSEPGVGQREQMMLGPADERRYDVPWGAVPRQWLIAACPTPPPLTFSGGIEPFCPAAVNSDQYATCNEFCPSNKPNGANYTKPPPLPPQLRTHSQFKQQQQPFSPNTSGGSMSRHGDDSGLDSV